LQCATVCCRKCVAVYFSKCVTSGQGLAVRNKRRQFANISALSLHVLQRIAVCCSVLQCAAVSVLQCISANVSPVGKAWQYAINADSSPILVRSLFMYCSVLQCVAVCYSVSR